MSNPFRELAYRLKQAGRAFMATEYEKYYLVELVEPLGYAVLFQFDRYDQAYDFRRLLPDWEQTRILPAAEWERQTLLRMRSLNTWLSLSAIARGLQSAEQEAANLTAIFDANFMQAFQEQKHP